MDSKRWEKTTEVWLGWKGVMEAGAKDAACLHDSTNKENKGKFATTLKHTLLKKNWSCSFARLIQACSKLFSSKCSKPKISRIPISCTLSGLKNSRGTSNVLIRLTIQLKRRP